MSKSKIKASEGRSARREAAVRAHVEGGVGGPNRGGRALTWGAAVFVFAVTWIAFWPALDGGWLDWDDLPLLYENERWRGFSAEHLGWMFTTFHMGPYQPLSWLSYAFDHALWGMNPRGYHATNLLLHATSAVCLYFLARGIFSIAIACDSEERGMVRGASVSAPRSIATVVAPPTSPRLAIGAALTAVLWSIHPLRVESVAWITERRDCLSGLFFLLTLLAWLARERSAEPRARRRWYRLAVLAFAASLLAKGLALVLPFVLLALDVWPLRRFAQPDEDGARVGPLTRARALVIEKWPFWLLSLVAAALAVVGQRVAGAIVTSELHGGMARVAQAFYGLAFYVRKSLWPADIMVLHPIPVPLPFGEMRFVASEIAVVLAVVLLVLVRRRSPALVVALSAYVVIIAPVLGFVQTGSQLVAARYSYLACVPLTLFVGGAVLWSARGAKLASAAALLAGAVLVGLGIATAGECRVWHDTYSLWKHDLAIDPKDNAARRNLIVAYLDQGRSASDPALRRSCFESALEQCREGLQQGPDAAYYANAAKVYDLMVGDSPADSRRILELALDQARRGIDVVEHSNQRLPEIYETCGVILCKLERPAEAVPCFEKLVAADSSSATRYGMLADALMQCGRARDAIAPLQAALRIAPDEAAIWLELGDARRQLGDRAEAIEAYRRVIEIARGGHAAVTDAEVAGARQAIEELSRAR